MEGIYKMSSQTFEISNIIAISIGAISWYILPFNIGWIAPIIALIFISWSIPSYVKQNSINKIHIGYFIVGLALFFAGVFIKNSFSLPISWIGFYLMFRFVVILFFAEDNEQIEREFSNRISAIIEKYESDLHNMQQQLDNNITIEEFNLKANEFKQAVELEYQSKFSLLEQRYQNKLKSLSSHDTKEYKRKISLLESQHQKDIDKVKQSQKKIIFEYTGKLHTLQQELSSEKKKNIVLKQENNELHKQQDKFIRDREYCAHNKMLRNQEIREALEDVIHGAKKEIDIISPWMNSRVVNDDFIAALNKAVDRGVTIKIRYGIGDISGSTDISSNNRRSLESKKVAQILKDNIKKKGHLYLRRGDEHSKLIICDDDYYIITSFNPLSFRGDYKPSDKDQRGEIGELSHDKANLLAYRKQYFSFTGIQVK